MREISLHILDICKNSTKAGATLVEVNFIADKAKDLLEFVVIDNGCGMDKEFLERVLDPFTTSRTTRKVGMGLPLLKSACEQTGGTLNIFSEKGVGTTLKATFKLSSIDRMPLGDMGASVAVLVSGDTHVEFVFNFNILGESFSLDTRLVKEEVGEENFCEAEVLKFIEDFINENISSLYGGEI